MLGPWSDPRLQQLRLLFIEQPGCCRFRRAHFRRYLADSLPVVAEPLCFFLANVGNGASAPQGLVVPYLARGLEWLGGGPIKLACLLEMQLEAYTLRSGVILRAVEINRRIENVFPLGCSPLLTTLTRVMD